MCGIVGVVRWDGNQVDETLLKKMASSLKHRGPDDEGYFISHNGKCYCFHNSNIQRVKSPKGFQLSVGLAHRRLSIIDLASGKQPLSNEDGSVWISFNGEIYNFLLLKEELESLGHVFQTNSDTEIIVHAYEEWGTDCLSRLVGMFAFAIWDEKTGRLFLARDRIGKKPLYYYRGDNIFLFASELKAILSCPEVKKSLDYTSLIDYLKYLYVPDPKSIYKDIFKLAPAHFLLLQEGNMKVCSYWDISFHRGKSNLSAVDYTEQLIRLLDDAVKVRMISEVPLGAFLSGGVDSSGIVALMSRHSNSPILTCSVGFDDVEHDETQFAREVANILKTDHREFFVKDNFIDLIKKLPSYFDEPFADSSAVPTFFVCKMARQVVTVALSGDGGDESFGGYHKYILSHYENIFRRFIPAPILSLIGILCFWDTVPFCRRAKTLAHTALLDPARGYYETNTFISDQLLDSILSDEVKASASGYDPFDYTKTYFNRSETKDYLSRLLYTDLKTYLPGDILVKVDRMSMANSLEVRAPLLDHRIIEFAAKIPSNLKIKGTEKKYILKEVFSRFLPREILDRPKHGFTVPLDHWFRNELKELSEQVLFRHEGTEHLLNTSAVRKLWELHQSGRNNCGTVLWSLLTLGIWHKTVIERTNP